MKIVIKEKVIPYILISLFSSIGLSAYGYKAEGQGGSKAVVWSISKIDTMQKNVQRNDERNPNIQNIEYLKKMFRQKAVDEISENIVYPLSDGPSIRIRRITKPDFRPCSTCMSRSQTPLCLCTLCMVSIHAEGIFGRLRYSLGGDRPSQTARLTLSRGPLPPVRT